MNYFFVRHALSLANIDKSLYHVMNDHEINVCEENIHKAEAAGEFIVDLLYPKSNPNPWHLYYSPFLRTKRTKDVIVKELAHHHIFPKINENPLLIERRWGNLRNVIEAEKDVDKYFDFFYTPEDGESYLQCFQRCVTFDNMLKLQVPKNDKVIIVGHGEQIKCYLMHLLGWTLEEFNNYENPDNCQVILVEGDKLSPKTPLKTRI